MARTKPKKRYTLAQQRRDPAKRSKLPMSKLTPAQQAQRKSRLSREQDARNPLLNPGKQLAGTDLRKAAEQITDAALNPKLAALDRQSSNAATQSGALSSRAGDVYRQIAEREAQSVARQQALGQALDKSLGIMRGTNATIFDDLSAKETQRQQADESVRGAGLGGENTTLSDLATLRARQAEQSAAVQDTASTQTGNWGSYQNALGQARQLRGGELQEQILTRLANQQNELGSERRSLESTRGDELMGNLVKLRQQSYENSVVNKELGIKEADLMADVAEARAKTQADNAKVNDYGYTASQWSRMTPAQRQAAMKKVKAQGRAPKAAPAFKDHYGYSTSEWSKMTPAQRRKAKGEWQAAGRKGGASGGRSETRTGLQTGAAQDRIGEARTVAKQLKAKGFPRQKVAQALVTGAGVKKVPELWASVALDIAYDGGVSAANVKKLHDRGYSVEQLGLKTQRSRGRRRRTGGVSGMSNAVDRLLG